MEDNNMTKEDRIAVDMIRSYSKRFPDVDWFGVYEVLGISGLEQYYDDMCKR